MPVILGDNSISVDGRVIETAKSTGQYTDVTGTGEPTVTSGETITPVVINNDFKHMTLTNSGYATLTADATNLKAWYKFDNPANIGLDSNPSTTKYNLTATIVGSGGVVSTDYISGGSSFQGEGNNDHVRGSLPVRTLWNNSTSGITLSIWFKRVAGTYDNPYNTSFLHFTNPGDASKVMYFSMGHYDLVNGIFCYMSLQDVGGETYINLPRNLTVASGWHHMVLCIDKQGVWTFYIDGDSITLVTGTTNGTIRTYGGASYPVANKVPNVTNVSIAQSASGGSAWIGYIDDFRVYDKVLSQAEVTQLYNTPAKTYTVNFTDSKLCDLLIIGRTNYRYLTGITLQGNYNISVGTLSSIIKSDNSVTYDNNSTANPVTNSITNTSITYIAPLIIIRYPRAKTTYNAQWTYNTSNANVYHLGNVGIGTNNPTNALHVIGNTHSTTYSSGKKTFKIEHPLKLNKWLYHGCIEGPRFDNIYRGKKLITEGKAEIDIDRECNTTGGMTSGTFPALNTNYQLYLQNNQTYDVVKGSINGSTISIECENTTDEIEIDWLVVGERHDEHVISTPLTDSDGNLICEHNMPGYVNNIDSNAENIPVTNIDITDESITDINDEQDT
jgi:hypothetical protein